jgi:hypothetical protein
LGASPIGALSGQFRSGVDDLSGAIQQDAFDRGFGEREAFVSRIHARKNLSPGADGEGAPAGFDAHGFEQIGLGHPLCEQGRKFVEPIRDEAGLAMLHGKFWAAAGRNDRGHSGSKRFENSQAERVGLRRECES